MRDFGGVEAPLLVAGHGAPELAYGVALLPHQPGKAVVQVLGAKVAGLVQPVAHGADAAEVEVSLLLRAQHDVDAHLLVQVVAVGRLDGVVLNDVVVRRAEEIVAGLGDAGALHHLIHREVDSLLPCLVDHAVQDFHVGFRPRSPRVAGGLKQELVRVRVVGLEVDDLALYGEGLADRAVKRGDLGPAQLAFVAVEGVRVDFDLVIGHAPAGRRADVHPHIPADARPLQLVVLAADVQPPLLVDGDARGLKLRSALPAQGFIERGDVLLGPHLEHRRQIGKVNLAHVQPPIFEKYGRSIDGTAPSGGDAAHLPTIRYFLRKSTGK